MFRRLEYNSLEDELSIRSRQSHRNFYILVGVFFGIATPTIVALCLIPTHHSSPDIQLLKQSAGTESTSSDIDNAGSAINTTIVRLNAGRLEGKILKSRGGRDFFAFHNIPYAKPPVGDLRFEPPQEYSERWRGIRDGIEPSDRCIQKKIGSSEVKGSEDCLYLSIFTPKLPSGRGIFARSKQDADLAVMVYIFGGGFIGGRGSGYGGDYMMDSDTGVVIVIPEYRLGTMGNLNTEDHVVPGNNGFKDQVMALKWVQKNIHNFGGNPKKVTIFGNSSGGMSVHAHIFSTMSQGLFHRGITQSGSALGLNVVTRNPRERAEDIATKIGCPVVNVTQKLVNCLKQANASDILSFQSSEMTGLTVETVPEDGDLSNTFLSDTPLNLLQQGRVYSDVPWIIGVNSKELAPAAGILKNTNATNFLNTNFDAIGPKLLELDVGSGSLEEQIEISVTARDFYIGEKNISAETRLEFVDMISDRAWAHPAYVAAKLYAQTHKSPVYLYWLTHEPLEGISDSLKTMFEPPYGVSHADEVQFLFPYAKFPYISIDTQDYDFSVKIVNVWSAFANGDTPLLVDDNLDVEWTPLTYANDGQIQNDQWLDLNEVPRMTNLLRDRMAFWGQFPLTDLFLANVSYA